MTGERVKEVTALYRKKLHHVAMTVPVEHNRRYHPDNLMDRVDMIGHCKTMLDQIDSFVDAGRMDKAFRWLGFVQGALWVLGIYSIEEMKNHNRP